MLVPTPLFWRCFLNYSDRHIGVSGAYFEFIDQRSEPWDGDPWETGSESERSYCRFLRDMIDVPSVHRIFFTFSFLFFGIPSPRID